jgi:hypothetical protein
MKNKEWGDKEVFFAETFRIAIYGAITFFAVNTIVRNLDYKDAIKTFTTQETISLNKEVVDTFLKASYSYTSELYDKLGGWKKPGEQDKEDERIEVLYDDYRNNLNRMKVYFGESIMEEVKKVDELLINLKPSSSPDDWKEKRNKLKDANNRIARISLDQLEIINIEEKP